MTEETLNDYVNKIQSFNMNEDKRFDAVHIKDAVMAGYNICRSECEKGDLEVAIRIGALEKENAELKAQIEKMKKYIKACWVEENLNDYSSYITNTSDEFRDLVKEINDEVRNGR